MARQVKGVLIAMVVGTILLVGGLFYLKSSMSDQEGAETATEVSSEGGTTAQEEGKEGKEKLSGKKVDSKQSLLEGIYDEGKSKQMKDHLKAIRESSR